MRKTQLLMENWTFTDQNAKQTQVNLPHTWNAIDGQDGGDDYYRGTCFYEKVLEKPAYDEENECVYLQFHGVNATADVWLNDLPIIHHDNGYSTFRVEVSDLLKESNKLRVSVNNSVNDRVYPQKADFTFYGGIYRNVEWLIVNKHHFELDYFGGPGIKVTPDVKDGVGYLKIEAYVDDHYTDKVAVLLSLLDAEGNEIQSQNALPRNKDSACYQATFEIANPHLWDGVYDPYLYTVKANLLVDESICDEILVKAGIRTFSVDVKKGFFLNGRSYPLHGVSRHQDFKGIGNAISHEQMEADMDLIREIGANTIRLAHYQHDQHFYDLCDQYGMIVWAEIPYISSHMPNGNENTHFQMKELIVQNYNHPSIVTWGISNEITISTKDKDDMLKNHESLQKLCKQMDPTRPTTMACYAVCGPFNKVTKITDLVAWNLYLGWYVPILQLNDIIMPFYHLMHPKQPFGYSEYGAEGMPNLHNHRARRGDHSEEYQAKYHEYMLYCFRRHKYMWATYVWNMFDFAADARNQGGEPGMNHKGLVTFDRKIKKDSFYLYKAFWSKEPFVHIAGKRYEHRVERYSEIKVYTNLPEVVIYNNGKKIASGKGSEVYSFTVRLEDENHIEVVAGDYKDQAVFYKTSFLKEEYKLIKDKAKSANWV